MPNIKIYGVVQNVDNATQVRKAKSIMNRIKDLFADTSYFDETVITFIPSIVTDFLELEQPYIQLELDCMNNYEEKIAKLMTLGYDIQVVKLHQFIPKG